MNLSFEPVTSERWSDFETLFGKRGACAGCWCMYWRQTGREFSEHKGSANKRAMRRIINNNEVPGLLAIDTNNPIGWCCVEPRERFARLNRSRTLKPVDDRPVWSIVCLFIRKSHRGHGVSTQLIEAAVDRVKDQGGRWVEGYPYIPKTRWADAFLYTGTASAFLRAGFREVARPSTTRAIMRRRIGR